MAIIYSYPRRSPLASDIMLAAEISGPGEDPPVVKTFTVGQLIELIEGGGGVYAPLDSPQFTGTPYLPIGTTGVTRAISNNSTSLATTAFVQSVITAIAPGQQNLQQVTTKGNVTTTPIEANSFVKTGGTGANVLLDNGNIVALSSIGGNQNLQEVTDLGSTTTNSITANSFIKNGGTSTQFLMGNGSVTIGNGGVYSYEIHVSQVDGNDTTGTGAVLNPVASITKALTLITGQRRTIVIHPGNYTENPSITTQYTVLTTYEVIAGNTLLTGTLTTSTGCSITGLKMTNLTITAPTGTGNVNILNCDISGTLTKSSTADYTLIRFCDIGATSITGANLVAIFGGNPNFVTVNNAAARVIVKTAVTVAPVLTAGSLSLVDSIVIAAVTNAFTSAAGTFTTLTNSQFLISALNNVAPVVLNGFYSILNCVFDKPNSTLVALSGTGGTTNSIVYSQFINADKFIKQGGTPAQLLAANGDSITAGTGITISGGTISLTATGITGLGISGSAQTGATQTLAVGTSGDDFGITSSGNTQTFNLPSAGSTQRGVVTTGAQTIAGAKTFSTGIIASYTSADTVASISATGQLIGLNTSAYPSLTQLGYVKGVTSAIQTQLDTATEFVLTRGNAALGSSIKGVNLSFPFINSITSTAGLSTGRCEFTAYFLPTAKTITGVKWWQAVAGVYTAANYCGVGLYSATTIGNMTLVAYSTNDGNIWKQASNSFGTKAFDATGAYNAAAGLYYIAILWASSATTTTPQTGVSTTPSAFTGAFDFSNSAKLTSSVFGQPALPTPTQNMSLTTLLQLNRAIFLY